MAKNLDDVYEQIYRLAGAQESQNIQTEQFRQDIRGLQQDIRGLDCKAHAARLDLLERNGRRPTPPTGPVRSQTGTAHHAVTDADLKEVTGKIELAAIEAAQEAAEEAVPSVDQIALELEKRHRDERRHRQSALAQWVGIIVGLLTIISVLGGVLMYVVKLGHRLDQQPDEMRSMIAAQGQRVVYVSVPQRVDAGAPEPPAPPPKRPRRK